MNMHSPWSWVTVSLVGLSALLSAGCDSASAAPAVFLIDCQAESPLPAWLDPGRAESVETELCVPLIRDLLGSDAFDQVSWRIWNSRFQVMLQAKPGSDPAPGAVAQSLHAALERSPLRRKKSYTIEQYWISPAPFIVQLAHRPEVDPQALAGSTSFVVILSEQQARRFGLEIKDIREQLAARFFDEAGAVAIRLRADIDHLRQTRITIPSGAEVPLGELAKIEMVQDGYARPWMTDAEFQNETKDIASKPRLE